MRNKLKRLCNNCHTPICDHCKSGLCKNCVLLGRPSPLKNRPISNEHKQAIGIALSGENNGFYGAHHSEQSRKQMSKNHADVSKASGHPLNSKESHEILIIKE